MKFPSVHRMFHTKQTLKVYKAVNVRNHRKCLRNRLCFRTPLVAVNMADSRFASNMSNVSSYRNTIKTRDFFFLLWRSITGKKQVEVTSSNEVTSVDAAAVSKEIAASSTSQSKQSDNNKSSVQQCSTASEAKADGSKVTADLSLKGIAWRIPSYLAEIAMLFGRNLTISSVKKNETKPQREVVSVSHEPKEKIEPPKVTPKKIASTKPQFQSTSAGLSREAIHSRTRYLIRAIATANSTASRLCRLQDFCRHVFDNPQAKSFAIKEKAIPLMHRLKTIVKDTEILENINIALALMGYQKPLPGPGIRILSIDGGGTRGLLSIEILRQLEKITQRPVCELFDFMCGVSTGAILCLLLGPLRMSVDEAEDLYKRTSTQIFTQNTWWGTGKLVLSHAFYDTTAWEEVLRSHIGTQILIDTARDPNCPKVACVATVMNRAQLVPFMFRNYDFPHRSDSNFPGCYSSQLWEAVRGSAAAPGYFEEFKIKDFILQDGGILHNNPCAIAIHEARHLWPTESIQCVVSVGNGRYEPQLPVSSEYSSLKTKLLKIVDSATDTEAVHTILNDLLQPSNYFRFNPYLSEFLNLDEIRPEKFQQLKNDAAMYLRINEHKVRRCRDKLIEKKSFVYQILDALKLNYLTYK